MSDEELDDEELEEEETDSDDEEELDEDSDEGSEDELEEDDDELDEEEEQGDEDETDEGSELVDEADELDGDEEDEDLDDDEEEFSLDQLSAAYAEVLAEQNATGGQQTTDESGDLPADGESSTESTEALEPTPHAPQIPARPEVDPEEVLAKELAACPVTPESILEAILFVGGPKEVQLSSRKIAAILRDVSPKEITKMAKELGAKYEKEKRAYTVWSEKGVHKIVLSKDLAEVQQRFLGRDRAVRLNQAVIDVLAVVAYNQPVSREQVDKVRGKSSVGILNQMVRRQLLVFEETEEKPRRRLFRTTDRFLDLFNLETIEDLPQSHDLDIEEVVD